MEQKQLQLYDAAGLFVLLKRNDIFSHHAKCVILENWPVQLENDYWHLFVSSMSEESAREYISQSSQSSYADISKAIHRVWHFGLLAILSQVGITGDV